MNLGSFTTYIFLIGVFMISIHYMKRKFQKQQVEMIETISCDKKESSIDSFYNQSDLSSKILQ